VFQTLFNFQLLRGERDNAVIVIDRLHRQLEVVSQVQLEMRP